MKVSMKGTKFDDENGDWWKDRLTQSVISGKYNLPYQAKSIWSTLNTYV